LESAEYKYRRDATKLIVGTNNTEEGRIVWQSPSNIALVKYWGKYNNQKPMNPSLSIGLQNAVSITKFEYGPKQDCNEICLSYFFNNYRNVDFEKRVKKYFDSLSPYFPFLSLFDIRINSNNTFPHSAGIASSASAFASIALCICSMEKELFGTLMDETDFYRKASFIARLGSGSASRSVFGGLVLWGWDEKYPDSTDEYAIPLNEICRNSFINEIRDAILIVDSGKKKISSSDGHNLMNDHPWAGARYHQARSNMIDILNAIEKNDLELFVKILESEALSLHALMLSSDPGYISVNQNTIEIINKVREFRHSYKILVGFTLDAGPNVHLIYPEANKQEVEDFIRNHLLDHCENGSCLYDQSGKGPIRLT